MVEMSNKSTCSQCGDTPNDLFLNHSDDTIWCGPCIQSATRMIEIDFDCPEKRQAEIDGRENTCPCCAAHEDGDE